MLRLLDTVLLSGLLRPLVTLVRLPALLLVLLCLRVNSLAVSLVFQCLPPLRRLLLRHLHCLACRVALWLLGVWWIRSQSFHADSHMRWGFWWRLQPAVLCEG